MAFEARYTGQFPPLLLGNREFMGKSFIGDGCGVQMAYGVVDPDSGTSTTTDIGVPLYGAAVCDAYGIGSMSVKSDSSLTCAFPGLSKRFRVETVSNSCGGRVFSVPGDEFSLQLQQQHLEIDRFTALHTEKLLQAEIESRRRRCTRRISTTIENSLIKTLKEKDEEIEKIGKLNWALEERVKSLSLENQIWKDLAQINEATANALRSNLQQVLSQVQAHDTDEESICCSSTAETPLTAAVEDKRMCRNCHRQESSVLLLPCRHLCLCTFCVSSLLNCPVCNSVNTGNVHVNLCRV